MGQISEVKITNPILSDEIIVGAVNELHIGIYQLIISLHSKLGHNEMIKLLNSCRDLGTEKGAKMLCCKYLEKMYE